MNKKILIGSILAVALLTLVSFSNVVGYSSVKSDSKLKSPLFNVRTGKAIDEEEHNIQCDFVGKGKDVFIFQNNYRMTELIEDIISDINNMDEEEFLILVQQVKNRFPENNLINNIDKKELIELFVHIQNNPDALYKFQKYISNGYYKDKETETIGLLNLNCRQIFWLIVDIISFIGGVLFLIIFLLVWILLPTVVGTACIYTYIYCS